LGGGRLSPGGLGYLGLEESFNLSVGPPGNEVIYSMLRPRDRGSLEGPELRERPLEVVKGILRIISPKKDNVRIK